MRSNKDYVEEEYFTRIKGLLKESKLKKLIGDDLDQADDIIEEFDDGFDDIDKTFPGFIKFRMDVMNMNLFMHMKAPVNSDNEITLEDIKSNVEEFGPFCEGQVDWNKIRDIYTRVMHKGELISEVIVAKGKPAEFKIPEHIILNDGFSLDYTPHVLDTEKVDYHNIKSFIPIAKGEELGRIIIEYPGSDGVNLLGKVIPAPKKNINNLSIGINVKKHKDKIYSTIDGAFKIFRDEILVDPVLSIPSDIDYSTGDVEFKGDVVVNGSIREGFSVKCDRDLFVSNSLEPANVFCKSTLVVKHGIIGSPEYTVECDGDIIALHIEHAKIDCRGSIKVSNSIVNAEINSLNKIITKETCSIVGGRYCIQNGINTGNIGNRSGVETQIYLGIDYSIERKLITIQNAISELIVEINMIQEKILSAKLREDRDKLKYLFLSLRNRQNSLNNYCRSMLSKLDKNDKSTLVVHGTIYPGTYIEICHVSYIIERELSGVIFSLNKSIGEIEFNYLK